MRKLWKNICNKVTNIKKWNELSNEEKKKRKRKILILLILIICIFLFVGLRYFSTDGYRLSKNSKANIVYVEKLIYTGNICNQEWIDEVKILINILNNDAKDIKGIESKNNEYLQKLNNFSALHKELAKALEELIIYIDNENKENLSISNLDNIILVNNVKNTYQNYKKYYNNEIARYEK